MPNYTVVTAPDARQLSDDEWSRVLFGTNVDGLVHRFKTNADGFRDEVMRPQEVGEGSK